MLKHIKSQFNPQNQGTGRVALEASSGRSKGPREPLGGQDNFGIAETKKLIFSSLH